MDNADKADEYVEAHLNESLKRIVITEPVYTGYCLSCGDTCGNARYCDKHCREDHEKKHRRRR